MSVLDVGGRDEKGDPWPFICKSRVSIGIGDGGGKWKRRDAASLIQAPVTAKYPSVLLACQASHVKLMRPLVLLLYEVLCQI